MNLLPCFENRCNDIFPIKLSFALLKITNLFQFYLLVYIISERTHQNLLISEKFRTIHTSML